MLAHIIDCDANRRAILARRMLDAGWHAEIFDSANEFSSFRADDGIVFVYDEPGVDEALASMEIWKGERGTLPVVFYSMERHIEQVIRAMLVGAADYLEWPIASHKINTLETGIDERAKLRRREIEFRFEANELVATLSKRERETLTLLTKGASNKAIAEALQISPRTVEIHRAAAFRKINAGSTADAVRIGVYAGLDLSE